MNCDRQIAIDILNAEICPYCMGVPEYVDSSVVYGKSYGMIYRCESCDAHVGVHKGTDKPLGRLANKSLREWKKKAHKAFDPVWKKGEMSRSEAYSWLAKELGISPEFCHIGMFSERYCKKTVELCDNLKKQSK